MSWTDQYWNTYARKRRETRLKEEQGLPIRRRRVLHNVRFCSNTGYLKRPTSSSEKIRMTRHFMLRHAVASPTGENISNLIDPVDPDLLVCTCQTCSEGGRPHPEYKKSITAYAVQLPPVPATQENDTTWKRLPSAPFVYWAPQQFNNGIEFKWKITLNSMIAEIKYFEVFTYCEIPEVEHSTESWEKLLDVYDMHLVLNMFMEGGKYHIAVRAVDEYDRRGPFSDPLSLYLTLN